MSTESDILRGLANTAGVIGTFLPGLGPTIATTAASALGLAADLAELGDEGNNPAFEIERIRSAVKLGKDRQEHWGKLLAERFGVGSAPPADETSPGSPPDTEDPPASDPYPGD